jgi:phospholipase/carboxylesterase
VRRVQGLSELGPVIVEWSGSTEPGAPLVVLLHGWGESEADMTALVPSLPPGLAYASVAGPYLLGRHRGWFATGRPFERTVRWFEDWLDGVAVERPVVLVGFSAGGAFGGGAILISPARYTGAAILCGTLPFDAGVSTPRGRLADKQVFVAHSSNDPLMPHDLLDRAWDYLTKDSGAIARAERYDSGHEITPDALRDLSAWLHEVTTAR